MFKWMKRGTQFHELLVVESCFVHCRNSWLFLRSVKRGEFRTLLFFRVIQRKNFVKCRIYVYMCSSLTLFNEILIFQSIRLFHRAPHYM